MRLLVMGNEWIASDALAFLLLKDLKNEFPGLTVMHVKDSFALMGELALEGPIIILDVVQGLTRVAFIPLEKLKNSSLLSAHDFDAGFVLKLLGEDKNIRIIGIPLEGNRSDILSQTKELLKIEIKK